MLLLAVLGLNYSIGFSGIQAQQPLYLPAEIPLDVEVIYKELIPATDYSETTQDIIRQMTRNHFSEIIFDDEFSTTLLDSFIKTLDGSRIYFTQADIDEFEQFRTTLDDLLQEGDIAFGYLIFNRYRERLMDRLVYSLQRIEEDSSDFDFTIDEFIITDRTEVTWAANESELVDLWRKRVKSSVLSMKLDDDEKEMQEIREDLSERYRSQLSQVLKTNGLDVYQRYMDAMTMAFDPHTQYYAPRAAENFNMSMRLSLEGIGAVLTTENEFTKVVSIVSGGPADLGGELQPADRIAGVAQGDMPYMDVTGWRVDDVVQLIRGEKGSVVRLNILPAGSSLEQKEISITRDTVKLEEQSAKKEIVEVEYEGETHRIGVIDLPTFYIDFEALQRRDPDYRSSTRDVQRLLNELKEEGVEGVVVDLRRNGGGSLSEANSLVGLFIRRGPTVQVRDAEGNNIVQGDPDPEIIYDGPLAVLVNRLSASASEIFAGAIQDYQRGLVLGSQTFGKGTVQELVGLGEGQMKITRAKFYRISGESTQHKGVTPDIVFPDLYDAAEDIGESALPTALPWDTIEPNYYRPYTDLKSVIPSLTSLHETRLTGDPDFNFIEAQIARSLENREKNQLTINEAALLEERAESDQWRLQITNARRVAKDQDPFASVEAMDEDSDSDEDEVAQNNAGADPVGPEERIRQGEENADPYLLESGKILMDLIELQNEQVTLALQQ
ncbi:MAG: carboxy terminal-processing peptidase [Gammaproteobacteria bacterium]|nr:carboxy terminal-processing peptidase [Gammaproteobacteria bacterium]